MSEAKPDPSRSTGEFRAFVEKANAEHAGRPVPSPTWIAVAVLAVVVVVAVVVLALR